jgi:hypothetical protein
MISLDGKKLIFALVRQRRWGHKVIREKDIQPKKMPNKVFKKALKEIVQAGYLRTKKGLGTNTYSLNSHMKKDILVIYAEMMNLKE